MTDDLSLRKLYLYPWGTTWDSSWVEDETAVRSIRTFVVGFASVGFGVDAGTATNVFQDTLSAYKSIYSTYTRHNLEPPPFMDILIKNLEEYKKSRHEMKEAQEALERSYELRRSKGIPVPEW